MATVDLKKYKISLNVDSAKQQGLHTGDIVRRQFFTGKSVIYSLMCVLDYGIDEVMVDEEREDGTVVKVKKQQPWFIGGLLEGDPPVNGEILDFARITNLFDTNRSGALYLTASDDYSPYMDIIDGIGRNCSLCWPESLMIPTYPDPMSQYCVHGDGDVELSYRRALTEYSRICTVKRIKKSLDFVGLKQDFYEYLNDSQQVVVSYRIKGPNKTFKASIGYQTRTDADEAAGNRTDGIVDVSVTPDWQYKVHVISIENSGRHLRDFRLSLTDLDIDEEVSIADFNIILLSSLANFGDASQMRVGRLDGVADPVFGKLSGYGAYLQKIFASQSAHISGTLTAGDENGFAATFYAGKIHKNSFINSLEIVFSDSVPEDTSVINPTGVGKVYATDSQLTLLAQENKWLKIGEADTRIGEKYCFSFWAYAETECIISVLQNDKLVGSIILEQTDCQCWRRVHVAFDIQKPEDEAEDVWFTLVPTFTLDPDDERAKELLHISAPQLESGTRVTQYQPTDDTLCYNDEYGAWFNRGGIGGTIQNPLLRLNNDGSIQSRSNSFLIRNDGSGHIAGGHIWWEDNGDMHFKDVTMKWEDFADDAKAEIAGKSIKITGPDTFTFMGDASGNDLKYVPESITLELEEINLTSNAAQRQWCYFSDGEYVKIPKANGKTLTVDPHDEIWGEAGSALTVKCIVRISTQVYAATHTIRKQYITGYTIEISSEQGEVFKNGICDTVLTANVYYQGKLVDPQFVADNFTLHWKKYKLPDLENEIRDWWMEQVDGDGNVIQEAIDIGSPEIHINSVITGRDLYVCELEHQGGFPYNFPVYFNT